MTNKLINMAVATSTFGAELIAAPNASAARVLLDVGGGGGGGGEVASVNGQVGAVVLDYTATGAASAAQGAKADTALQPGDAAGNITSVNGKTGAVVLTAADVGAATAEQGTKADTALQPGDVPTAPVSSVNGKTGAVSLAPADIGAATSAQGVKADNAVQPGSLATVATTGSYNSLTNLPTLGTAASQSSASFATAAQGAKADSAIQPANVVTTSANGLMLSSDKVKLDALPTNRTRFLANRGATSQTLTAATYVTVIYDLINVDLLTEYNTATGQLTVKNAGMYTVQASAHVGGINANSELVLRVRVNGNEAARVYNTVAVVTGNQVLNGVALLNLAANDIIEVQVFVASGTPTILAASTTGSRFGVVRLV